MDRASRQNTRECQSPVLVSDSPSAVCIAVVFSGPTSLCAGVQSCSELSTIAATDRGFSAQSSTTLGGAPVALASVRGCEYERSNWDGEQAPRTINDRAPR